MAGQHHRCVGCETPRPPRRGEYDALLVQTNVQRESQEVAWSTAAKVPAVVSERCETMTTQPRTLVTFTPKPMIKFTGIRRCSGLHHHQTLVLPLRLRPIPGLAGRSPNLTLMPRSHQRLKGPVVSSLLGWKTG